MTASRVVLFAKRPTGAPTADCFEMREVELPPPAKGEVQVRNLWMSVDPYMRGRMFDLGPSYASAFKLGEPLSGRAVGQVVASKSAGFQEGDFVFSDLGWREAFNADPEVHPLRKLNLRGLPPEAFLGVAGITGLTAWVGLLKLTGLRAGETVLVTAAAGAVGSVACQIAKLKGCKVIGSAGGPTKTQALLEQLGVDAAVDYQAHSGRLTEAFQHAAPDGIDVCLENVGGEHLEAAINVARRYARFALCGMISQYNRISEPYPVRNLIMICGKELRIDGYLVGSYEDCLDEFLDEVCQWYNNGSIRSVETKFLGLEEAPAAFMGLFSGENLGKAVVGLA
jgi:NADPH-dependent curcumin reductase CurA